MRPVLLGMTQSAVVFELISSLQLTSLSFRIHLESNVTSQYPPGIFDEVCAMVRKKLAAGVYEPSNSSYRSCWFCVLKKDGKALRPVHSLEPLNQVTIAHSGLPPATETL